MKVPELLAPAGNLSVLKGAALAGADAVYFGGELFGARAFAGNLTHDEILEALLFLHSHEKKAYLTVNTLLKNREIEERLFSYLRDFYEAGLDAVLIQDWGVLSFVRASFPELPIHASTQMCVSSPFGYEFLKACGVVRAVPARELSVDEIRTLCAIPGIETEVFVHGAMCVCYSGRCYLSGMIGDRSANRGRCGQPCRLPYTGFMNNKKAKLPNGGRYPVSMKDLCGLPALPDLCRAGVASLKIEGRMKGEEYVTGVVSVYRKYLDDLKALQETDGSTARDDLSGGSAPEGLLKQQTEDFSIEPSDLDDLKALGNRGNFAHTYYFKNNGPEMISFSDSSFHSDRAALAQARARAAARSGPEGKAPAAGTERRLDMKFFATAGSPMTLTAAAAEEGALTPPAAGGLFADNTPVSVTVTGEIAETASKKATTEAEVREKLLKLGGSGFSAGSIEVALGDNVFLPMSRVNALRREAIEQLNAEMDAREASAVVTDGRPADENLPSKCTICAEKIAGERKAVCHAKTAPDIPESSTCIREDFFSVMNLSQLAGAKGTENVLSLILPAFLLLKDKAVGCLLEEKRKGRKLYLSLPYVFRKRLLPFEKELKEKAKQAGFDGFFVSQVDSLQYLLDAGVGPEKIVADPDLYVFNNRAASFYAGLGLQRFSFPYELNFGEMKHLPAGNGILTVYGRVSVMKTANCLVKNTGKCEEKLLRQEDRSLLSYTDRKGASVPVIRDCMNCINIMYNSVPTNLLPDLPEVQKAGFAGYRLDFTTETEEEVQNILASFEKARGGEDVRMSGTFTRGHFRRGVD